MLVLSSGQIYTESLLLLFFYRNGFKMRGLLKKPLKKLPCFIKATGKSILITVINVSGLFFFFFPHVCLKKVQNRHWTLNIPESICKAALWCLSLSLVNDCTETSAAF